MKTINNRRGEVGVGGGGGEGSILQYNKEILVRENSYYKFMVLHKEIAF